ncbi:MAG TPA: hypothetical protein VG269_12345 [Tepidisphaeraceae bacterium]|jgi:hypothetical protein|nr:hypothetical protein [Tepidisphaeraceae bacterium]
MEFLLGILVVCVLAGAGWPQLVRSRLHYLLAIGCVAVALLFTALAELATGGVGGWRALLFFAYAAEIAAVGFLLCAGGGLSFTQLGRDLLAAFRNLLK